MQQSSRIVLLGSGNVAHHLARRISQAEGLRLVQIYSRRLAMAQALSTSLDEMIPTTDDLDQIERTADYYLLCVSDAALPEVWAAMPETQGIWLHTAGSVPLEDMQEIHRESGVLYPLQTLSKTRPVSWERLPLYLEATTPEVYAATEALARRLSSTVYPATSQQRLHLHLSAVLACNFTNHLVALGQMWMADHGLEPSSLLPLIEETMAKLGELSAREAQTGPARRGDQVTMQRHLALLGEVSPELMHLYEMLSHSIERMYRTE